MHHKAVDERLLAKQSILDTMSAQEHGLKQNQHWQEEQQQLLADAMRVRLICIGL